MVFRISFFFREEMDDAELDILMFGLNALEVETSRPFILADNIQCASCYALCKGKGWLLIAYAWVRQ